MERRRTFYPRKHFHFLRKTYPKRVLCCPRNFLKRWDGCWNLNLVGCTPKIQSVCNVLEERENTKPQEERDGEINTKTNCWLSLPISNNVEFQFQVSFFCPKHNKTHKHNTKSIVEFRVEYISHPTQHTNGVIEEKFWYFLLARSDLVKNKNQQGEFRERERERVYIKRPLERRCQVLWRERRSSCQQRRS